MRHVRHVLAIGSCFLLASCGSFVPVVRMDHLPADQRQQIAQVRIFNDSQLVGKDFEVLSVVEGNACQNKVWDPPATRTMAIEQIKYFAWEAGANGVANIQCAGREGTSARTNCWELISCTAEAIRIGD